MQIDQLVIFALTYLGGMALKKWPEYKDEYIPRATYVIAIAQQVVANLAHMGTASAVAPAYATTFASFGMPAAVAVPLGGDVASLILGTKVWLGTQVFHLVFEKLLLKGLFKKKV